MVLVCWPRTTRRKLQTSACITLTPHLMKTQTLNICDSFVSPVHSHSPFSSPVAWHICVHSQICVCTRGILYSHVFAFCRFHSGLSCDEPKIYMLEDLSSPVPSWWKFKWADDLTLKFLSNYHYICLSFFKARLSCLLLKLKWAQCYN